MRSHKALTLASQLQTNSSSAAVETGELNIFTVFPFVVAGTLQVETATAAGTITGSGNATVTVTAAGMTGSPKAISVAVLNGDTAAQWAEKVRVALAADADVTALFNVSGTGTAIVLTRKTVAASDATLNVALANGTCTGITAAPTSANTVAGATTGNAMTLTLEGRSPNGDWHALATGTVISTAGAQSPIQLSTFCDAIRATLTSWTAGNITVTALAAIRG